MKGYRYAKIREIVQNQNIETQEDLAAALEQEGIEVTQATISRDIKEMMLIKVPCGDGKYKYAVAPDEPKLSAKNRLVVLFKDAVTNITVSKNIVVIRTMPGAAQAVAFALDNIDLPEIIGTLAGDDTILLVVAENVSAKKFKDKLYTFFREV